MRLDGVPNLTLHTTEVWDYIPKLRVPSQWQVGEGQIGQHIRDGLAGDALFEWDRFSMGIEIVYRVADQAATKVYLPGQSSLGPLVALVAWLHRTGRIRTGLKRPTDEWPLSLDRLPAATVDYYRRKSGLWEARVPGVYGHVEVPGNKHYDPASFDYDRFFALVREAIRRQEEEDMTDEERNKLNKAYNLLVGLADELGVLPNALALGRRVARSVVVTESGASHTHADKADVVHEHDLRGKAV
jgi:hypothetical protein